MEMYFFKGERSAHIMNELELKNTSVNSILKIFSSANFTDFLESYFELCNREMLDHEGISVKLIQDDIFTLSKGAVRIMYGHTKTLNPVLC